MALTVTPPATSYRYGDTTVGTLSFVASGATGTVHWAVDNGSMSPATGASSVLTPTNRTKVVTVTATDDNGSVLTTIQINATFPYQPKWGIDLDMDPLGVTHFPFAAEGREWPEYWAALQFFAYHGRAVVDTSEAEDGTLSFRLIRGKLFYVYEIATGRIMKGYFDSAIRIGAQGADWVNYSFQFTAINAAIPAHPEAGPWIGDSSV